jgi:hypothetical protein
MKNKFYNFILASCLVFSANTFAQSLAKDSLKVQKIISEGVRGASGVVTINDKGKVAFLSKYIDARNLEKKAAQEKLVAAYESRLGMRYKKDDKTTVPKILAILKSKDHDAIENLLDELDNDQFYDDEHTPLYLDAEIKAAVFDLVYNEEFEQIAIQFIGFNKVEGYIPLFEDRLLSDKSLDEDRLLFWLSYTGSEKAIDHMIARLKSDPSGLEDMAWFIGNLDEFFKNGPEKVKAKILDLCYGYIAKHPLTKEDIAGSDEADEFAMTGRQIKLSMLEFLFRNGDKRNLEMAAGLIRLAQDADNGKNVLELNNVLQVYLLRFHPLKEQKAIVLKALENKEDFFDVLTMTAKEEALINDPEIKDAVFKKFGAFNFYEGYEIEELAKAFPKLDRAGFEALVKKNISNEASRQRILEVYGIYKQTIAETNDYLYRNGLIAAPITQQQVDSLSKEDIMFGGGAMHNSLFLSGISYAFDAEPDTYPVDHDELLLELVKKSQGKLQGIKAYQQNKYDKNTDTTEMTLLAIYNNKCFVMMPEDLGDWYDVQTIDQLLKAIVMEAGIKERFVPLNTGDQTVWYIFGEGEKVGRLATDYKLEYTATIGDQE